MASHLSVQPAAAGRIRWASARELTYEHPPFRPSTVYTVRLRAGYRDAAGNPNQLAHGWTFTTEAPPSLTASAPAPREQNVDPAGYIALQFSRAMDIRSLQEAVSISPFLPLSVRADPGDARRAIIAPRALLEPSSTYSLTVTPDARDVDGNSLAAGVSLDFATGAQRPLSHWVTYLADQPGSSAGIWVVDSTRIPRQLAAVPADGFDWSPDGTRLLARAPSGTWSDIEVGGGRVVLPIQGAWAAFLAPPLGYAYLQDGVLSILSAGGVTTRVDTGVGDVAVSPDGRRLVYVAGPRGAHGASGTEIRGYSSELRSHYRIAVEGDAVDALSWSPDATHIAYRVGGAEGGQSRIRVKDLFGSGASVTVAIGQVGAPGWQADSRHVILSATVAVDQQPRSLPFRLGIADAATRPLSADQAIPTPAGVEIVDPVPSPDGHQVAFLQPVAGRAQVFVMNVDGSGFGALTAYDEVAFPYSCRAPAWTRA